MKKILNKRNYQKEAEWSKERYTRLEIRIEKELGQQLKEKLKKENISIAEWTRKNAEDFLKN